MWRAGINRPVQYGRESAHKSRAQGAASSLGVYMYAIQHISKEGLKSLHSLTVRQFFSRSAYFSCCANISVGANISGCAKVLAFAKDFGCAKVLASAKDFGCVLLPENLRAHLQLSV